MQTRIVAISHAWGSGGENIGRAVADALRFRYVNEEVITLAADKHGLDERIVADVERRKGLLHRLVEGLRGNVVVHAVRKGVLVSDANALARRKDMRAFIVGALHDIAAHGNAVIVAHAASMALAGRSDLFRVLVTASEQTRIDRLAEGTGRDRLSARQFMQESDAARADYFWRFYQIKDELPTHYDLVVNTDMLSLDEAVDVIVAAARRRGSDSGDGAPERARAPRARHAEGARRTAKARSRAGAARRR